MLVFLLGNKNFVKVEVEDCGDHGKECSFFCIINSSPYLSIISTKEPQNFGKSKTKDKFNKKWKIGHLLNT